MPTRLAAVGDWDGDGDGELLIGSSRFGDGERVVLDADPDDPFRVVEVLALPGAEAESEHFVTELVGDFDADGGLDVAIGAPVAWEPGDRFEDVIAFWSVTPLPAPPASPGGDGSQVADPPPPAAGCGCDGAGAGRAGWALGLAAAAWGRRRRS